MAHKVDISTLFNLVFLHEKVTSWCFNIWERLQKMASNIYKRRKLKTRSSKRSRTKWIAIVIHIFSFNCETTRCCIFNHFSLKLAKCVTSSCFIIINILKHKLLEKTTFLTLPFHLCFSPVFIYLCFFTLVKCDVNCSLSVMFWAFFLLLLYYYSIGN